MNRFRDSHGRRRCRPGTICRSVNSLRERRNGETPGCSAFCGARVGRSGPRLARGAGSRVCESVLGSRCAAGVRRGRIAPVTGSRSSTRLPVKAVGEAGEGCRICLPGPGVAMGPAPTARRSADPIGCSLVVATARGMKHPFGYCEFVPAGRCPGVSRLLSWLRRGVLGRCGSRERRRASGGRSVIRATPGLPAGLAPYGAGESARNGRAGKGFPSRTAGLCRVAAASFRRRRTCVARPAGRRCPETRNPRRSRSD